MSDPCIVAIIPAREGSKGIRKKSLQRIDGKTLIGRVVLTAKAVPEIERVLVTTDDEDAAWIAQVRGADILYPRPANLCRDETPTLPVLQHAIRWLESERQVSPDIVVLLYATSPLLTPARISQAIQMMQNEKYDSLVSVTKDYGHFWFNGERLYPKTPVNRQQAIPLYRENGAIYIATRETLMERNQLVGGRVGFMLMHRGENIDIDTVADLERARVAYAERQETGEPDYQKCA